MPQYIQYSRNPRLRAKWEANIRKINARFKALEQEGATPNLTIRVDYAPNRA